MLVQESQAISVYQNRISENTIVGGEYGIIIGGGFGSKGNEGPWNVIRSNNIQEAFAGGIGVNDHSYDQIIEDNDLIGNDYGIRIFYNSDRTFIWNNRISGWYELGAGIFVEDSNQTQILGNRLTEGDTNVAIELDENCQDYTIRGNEIFGQEIQHPNKGEVD